ncbi:MAG: amidohydrolase family protein [Chitinophagales bacterium]|nr:amidohydrolase family protein [Chitinophagales bacterium]
MKSLFTHLIFALLLIVSNGRAQETTFPTNGVDDYRTKTFAFNNATIVVDHQTTYKNATLIIRNGLIVAVGNNISIPKDAVVEDAKGKFIYPSFIELNSAYGIDKSKPNRNGDGNPKMISDKKGAFGWNKAIRPEMNAYDRFGVNNGEAETLRKSGFGTVLTHFQDGIVRGTGSVVLLSDKRENEVFIKDKASAHYSFSKGSSDQDYPSSLMGSIALLRQTYLDVDWYQKNKTKVEYNISLESFNALQNLPQVFEVYDRLDILRADKIAKEFGKKYIIKGNGDEYARAKEIKNTNASLIIPINFPKPYDVSDPIDALTLDYASMKNWEMAPSNPYFLYKENIPFCFTSSGIEKAEDFLGNLRKAIKRGLPENIALMKLTSTPAEFLQISDKVGSLHAGKLANFIICSKALFEEKNVIHQNWIKGNRYIISPYSEKPINASYNLELATGEKYEVKVNTKDDALTLSFKVDTNEIKVKVARNRNLVNFTFNPTKNKLNNVYRLSGSIAEPNWTGTAELPQGKMTTWKMTFIKLIEDSASIAKDSAKLAKADTMEFIGKLIYPFTSFGNENIPVAKQVLIKNATVWTNESNGIMKNADVLINQGKIAQVGNNLSVAGAEIVDGTGKHLTNGIVDEHSHIAISRGVNEGAQASSSEVRIGDVVTSDDVNIYRQLAGGVIASQLLHGSANPIGGQSALIKLRWGYAPEQMKIAGADEFIKFALGENVKQSNWGDRATVRFPQTRMGVEQVYYNYFTKAKEYEQNLKIKPIETRRDIELDALLEIINKKRFITCHSYVQSEINMLMHVADSFGFRVNTFTHILEGYKVADKMKAHGVNASTFSDWWAYKYEVIDAIPYNAAILTKAGVNTSINSDDAEMGRRLNQEAAKTIKYGGMTEEDAWKMVTLNPCKMLHLDQKMGSIKAGKDADLVLWNEHPLSIYAKPIQTYVDGIRFFDVEEHKLIRARQDADRARIIQKMMKEKEGGASTQKVVPKAEELWNCGHEED